MKTSQEDTTSTLWHMLNALEVAANTAAYAYKNRPENFAMALRSLEAATEEARVTLMETKDKVNL